MTIVVTTPTGNIGSVVTEKLLAAGENPVLVARDPAKVQNAVNRGATVVPGDHGDANVLTEATRGADALFVVVPGSYEIEDILAFYGRFAEAAAQAATENKVGHVVLVSSAGADRETGNGPVAGLFLAEKILREAGIANLTFLRPGYFMENTLGQIPNILQARKLFTPFHEGVRFPMIATRDIGVRAADVLQDRTAHGQRVLELHGGPETSYEEVAEVLSRILERDIAHVTVGADDFVGAMTGMGVSQVLAEALVELNAGIESGLVRHREQRSEATTTPTDYPTFAQEVFRPALLAAEQG